MEYGRKRSQNYELICRIRPSFMPPVRHTHVLVPGTPSTLIYIHDYMFHEDLRVRNTGIIRLCIQYQVLSTVRICIATRNVKNHLA